MKESKNFNYKARLWVDGEGSCDRLAMKEFYGN